MTPGATRCKHIIELPGEPRCWGSLRKDRTWQLSKVHDRYRFHPWHDGDALYCPGLRNNFILKFVCLPFESSI
jgi:hypothetical protein